jgi:hypothetical protein
MQVNCIKCSRPIGVTDVVESCDGRLSHLDCKRPRTLTPEERALIFMFCKDHHVAVCPSCNVGFLYTELVADPLGEGTNLCRQCRRDLFRRRSRALLQLRAAAIRRCGLERRRSETPRSVWLSVVKT